MAAFEASPRYDIDDEVTYNDRQGVVQRGKVLRIEATWSGEAEVFPFLTYTVSHPTYRDKKMYAGEADIIGLAPRMKVL